MKRLIYELSESWKIAAAQMRSNMTRSMLTALGVIIGIVAVTLMGTAISGIQTGFDKSMSVFGDDVLYVEQWPWRQVDDWWNYRDRKKIKTEYADPINRMIAADAQLKPGGGGAEFEPFSAASNMRTTKWTTSSSAARSRITSSLPPSISRRAASSTSIESRGGANVCVIGYDVADALFPGRKPDRQIGPDQRPKLQSHWA